MPRLKPVPTEHLDATQQRVHDLLVNGPRRGVRGPWLTLLHAPELCERLERVGHYHKFDAAISRRLAETAVLVLMSHYRCEAGWALHMPLAHEAGLAPEITEAIHAGVRPPFDDDDPAAHVHDFCTQLLKTGHVTDDVYDRTLKAVGDRALIELHSALGYYTIFAFALNAHPR